MSELIIVGIIVILGVNGLYSRFCEQPKEKRWAISFLQASWLRSSSRAPSTCVFARSC